MKEETCLCTDDCALGFNPNCSCNYKDCNCRDISNMIGEQKATVFNAIVDYIDSKYTLDKKWTRMKIKTKRWKYEYKFSKANKTLCGFYITDNFLGFMLIFGKNEREKIECNKNLFSKEFLELYNNTETYHDGKWVMLELNDLSLFDDIKILLEIKRKPNKNC